MKVLVLSLMRVGDTLMALSALKRSGLAISDSSLDICVFKGQSFLKSLCPSIRHVVEVDRDGLQHLLGDKRAGLYAPVYSLRNVVNQLNSMHYDVVINCWPNRFSGHIASSLKAGAHIGLHFNTTGLPQFGSRVLRVQNSKIGRQVLPFHWVDTLSLGLREAFGSVDKVQFQVDDGWRLKKGDLFIQFFSNDPRKEIHPTTLIPTLKRLQSQQSSQRIILLGAPFERERLVKVESQLRAAHVQAEPFVGTFLEVHDHLKGARALITCDTSIKHLASLQGVPTIELTLGPSEYRETGCRSEGSFMVVPKASCYPCAPRGSCDKWAKHCETQIDPHALAEVVESILCYEQRELERLASYAPFRIYQTLSWGPSLWFPRRLGYPFARENLRLALDQAAGYLLTVGKTYPLPPIGSLACQVKEALGSIEGHEILKALAAESDNKHSCEDLSLATDFLNARRFNLDEEIRREFVSYRAQILRQLEMNIIHEIKSAGGVRVGQSHSAANSRHSVSTVRGHLHDPVCSPPISATEA